VGVKKHDDSLFSENGIYLVEGREFEHSLNKERMETIDTVLKDLSVNIDHVDHKKTRGMQNNVQEFCI